MKLSRNFLALSFASATFASIACVGEIPGRQDSKGNNPANPDGVGNPNDPTRPPGAPNPNVTPPPVAVGGCTEATLAKPRAWRLTHAQVRNSLRDSFGFVPAGIDALPPEARIDQGNSRNGFENRSDNLNIAPLLADGYFKVSEELANEVLAKSGDFGLACQVSALGSGDCLKKFIATFGLKMWRRPLSDAEIGNLTSLYTTSANQGDGPQSGLKNVVQAMFLSPNFLYRSEIGDNRNAGQVTRLTDHELASALSYALWDTTPDATLLDLASKGLLRDKTVLVEQAKRLLSTTPKMSAAIHGFVEQWLHTEDVGDKDKDLMTYSLGTKQMGAELLAETRKLVDSVFFEPGGDKSFKTLFTANYGFVNARTAAIYGVQGVTGDQLVKKEFDAKERRGILTQASFMWGHANPDGTHPVERGRYFREEILCEGVPDPPPTVIINPQFGNATLSNRERLEIHLGEPACAACHKLIDGLGLAMENFDGVGRYRTEEIVQGGAKKPINASGTVPLPSEPDTVLEFQNFIELVDKLATKPDVYTCFASQFQDYATGRGPGEINKCERKLVTDEFVKSGYKLDALVLSVVSSPSFSARKN